MGSMPSHTVKDIQSGHSRCHTHATGRSSESDTLAFVFHQILLWHRWLSQYLFRRLFMALFVALVRGIRGIKAPGIWWSQEGEEYHATNSPRRLAGADERVSWN